MLEWMCGDTSCVNTTLLCDGVNNCPDGTDESFCSFMCFNGEEISLEKNCNGVPDCPDGEDENNCFPFLVDDNGKMIDFLTEDSETGTEGTECDPLDQFRCQDGDCIPIEKVCDGTNDCLTEEDEANCNIDGRD